MIVPQIKAYDAQFQWRDAEFAVWDKKWVDLMKYNDIRPYFYDECLHPSKTKNSRAMVFKTEQFSIFVVVPEKQWEEFQEFKEKHERKKLESNPPVPVPPARACRVRSSAVASTPFASMCSTPSSCIDPLLSHQSNPLIPLPSTSTPLSYSTFDAPLESPEPIQPSNPISKATSVSGPPLLGTIPSTSAKRHHQHSRSTSGSSTWSPPPKKPTKATFTSPDWNELREALKGGGAMDFDVKRGKWYYGYNCARYSCCNVAMKQKVEPINFHPIPTLDLDQLTGEKVAFDVNSAKVFSGNVRLNLGADTVLGVGAFKTAQAAHLMLSPLRPSGLGSRPNHPIVVKRFYIGHEATGSGPVYVT